MKNTYGRIRNIARNTKTVEIEKCTLQNLEYGEKTENHGK